MNNWQNSFKNIFYFITLLVIIEIITVLIGVYLINVRFNPPNIIYHD